MEMATQETLVVKPDGFEAERFFYTRVLNARMHPVVHYFFSMSNQRIAERYVRLHPWIPVDAVQRILACATQYFFWGGTDLFHVITEQGERRMMVVETNSCPSGQKSMPLFLEHVEQAGYQTLLSKAFLPRQRRRDTGLGGLAVLFDKNPMEATGYAAVLAQLTDEPVFLVPFFEKEPDPPVRFTPDGVLHVRVPSGDWCAVRAALRYVTQRPWNRIPLLTKTRIINPVLTCISGGRNKMLAAKAYDIYNSELAVWGLKIHTPKTIWDLSLREIPLWVHRMGGIAVVKEPYSNAGQGVFCITNKRELDTFMNREHQYDKFIVQSLIGDQRWFPRGGEGRSYHVGTVPNQKGHIYATDLRFMVGVGLDGFFPVALYARRARKPLAPTINNDHNARDMLSTNLSVRREDGSWDTENERLLLMDSRDFSRLGIGLDGLIEAYIQTVLAVQAIDQMAVALVNTKNRFRRRLFSALNPDPSLQEDIFE